MASTYIFNVIDTSYYKIGVSSNVPKRLSSIQSANPMDMSIIMEVDFISRVEAERAEAYLHRKHIPFHIRNEWFKLSFIQLKICMGMLSHIKQGRLCKSIRIKTKGCSL